MSENTTTQKPMTQSQKLDLLIEGRQTLSEEHTVIDERCKKLEQQYVDLEKQGENIKFMLVNMEEQLVEQSKRIIWIEWLLRPIVILLFGFALLIVIQSKGCNILPDPSPNPGPNPKPPDEIIYVMSQAELNVIQSALNIVSREWNANQFTDLGEAVESLDALMGGSTDGVTQSVQERILVEFTGGRNFTESVDYVRSKLQVKK